MNLEPERLAEDLEAFLAARQAAPASPAPAGLPDADTALAAALLDIARTLEPDATFAADLEARLQAQAQAPRTPPRSGGGARPWDGRPPRRIVHLRAIARRRPPHWRAWATAAALLLVSLLVLAPPVQARLRDILRIGAVRIGWTQPTPAPRSSPTPTPLPSILDLAGQTTLAHAEEQAGFTIRLPTYPPELGPPNRVYLQQTDEYGPPGTMVVLVWLDPAHPSQVRLSLFELSSNIFFYKLAPQAIQETTVNGQRALWTTGPYYVEIQEGDQTTVEQRTLVTGHSLLWTDGAITYRLETDLSLPEAVRIAQSLR
jgi:hypothetical protein